MNMNSAPAPISELTLEQQLATLDEQIAEAVATFDGAKQGELEAQKTALVAQMGENATVGQVVEHVSERELDEVSPKNTTAVLQTIQVSPSIKPQESSSETLSALVKYLKNGRIKDFLGEKDRLALPAEFLTSTDVVDAAPEGMLNAIKYGDPYDAAEIKKMFNLEESAELHSVMKEMIIRNLAVSLTAMGTGGSIDIARLMNKFTVPDEILHDPEVVKAVVEDINYGLNMIYNDRKYLGATIYSGGGSTFLDIEKRIISFKLSVEVLSSPKLVNTAREIYSKLNNIGKKEKTKPRLGGLVGGKDLPFTQQANEFKTGLSRLGIEF